MVIIPCPVLGRYHGFLKKGLLPFQVSQRTLPYIEVPQGSQDSRLT